MSQLQALKSTSTLAEIAALLKYKAQTLAYILYGKTSDLKYTSFEIQKRGGGTRVINAPISELKLLQRHLADLLQDCVEEINKAGSFKDHLAHGFKRKRSIISNATKHRRRKYVFNVDLQDFFGTINFGRVRGFFIANKDFALNPAVATILAQIACHQNALPQGSPCSPVISNLIGHVLDVNLGKLAYANGCTYSRYADDLTFSTNKPDFPSDITKRSAAQAHKWEPGNKLHAIIRRSGFTLNPTKTRMQYRTSRQDVTGLVVNSKVNIRSEYRRSVRAMCHHLFNTGKFQKIVPVAIANNPNLLVPTSVDGTLAQLHGMLGHINGVDLYNDRLPKQAVNPVKPSINSKENLYRRFLMFKEFYVTSVPVLVCEGKTDSIYMKFAIRSRAAGFPSLASVVAGKPPRLSVRIPSYPLTATGRILKLKGGTGPLAQFIRNYANELERFTAPGKQNPVILLVDSDDGLRSINDALKQFVKVKVTGKESFVYVTGNIYIVATPLAVGQASSKIEDAFGALTSNLTIGGKTFNPDDDNFEETLHYDKHIFSQYVKEKAGTIDFTGFDQILTRIAEVIEDYKARIA